VFETKGENRFELGSEFVEEKFPLDCPKIVICIAVVVVWVVVASHSQAVSDQKPNRCGRQW
jgi:hypothetical protein